LPCRSITGLDLNSNGTANTSGGTGAITQINILSNGTGGFIFTDQNNQTLSTTATANLFSVAGSASGISTISLATGANNGLLEPNELSAINTQFSTGGGSAASAGTVLGVISGLDLNSTNGSAATAGTPNAITSITVESNGTGGFEYVDQNGNQLSTTAATNLFTSTTAGITAFNGAQTTIGSTTAAQASGSVLASVNTDADFAQETANLSKAQVLQQAGISVLAQANSNPQQVLKLLQ
jgi:flagellin